MTCAECGSGDAAEWTCLTCDVSLHDKCIQRHRGDNQGKTHTIIPGFDAFLHTSGVSNKASEPRIDKITVTGPGVQESGVVGEYDTTFHVNTYGAGPGRLGVKVEGPKAAFNVTMEPHKENKTTIVCSYQAEEAGDYVITVTWSEKEVHGSPFKVRLKNSES
ncbi:filamin-C-like [Ostrea edulis]|uniref:filamin-C-like n=1 Tax=Ostrea edulis TaxID=37623 RepID=UPI002095CA4C|nr:filamin-C-like [Ostrea edulis]XP_048749679.1 filamin-C-like [Ostrea edulis]XP_056002651.1 filamin-C-like [Ostrea edulis]